MRFLTRRRQMGRACAGVCTATGPHATLDATGKSLAELQARAVLCRLALCTITETGGLCLCLLGQWLAARALPLLPAAALLLRQAGAPA